MSRPYLAEEPKQTPPFQWRTGAPWRDPVTNAFTDYLAGFYSRAAAVKYGRMVGYLKGDENE